MQKSMRCQGKYWAVGDIWLKHLGLLCLIFFPSQDLSRMVNLYLGLILRQASPSSFLVYTLNKWYILIWTWLYLKAIFRGSSSYAYHPKWRGGDFQLWHPAHWMLPLGKPTLSILAPGRQGSSMDATWWRVCMHIHECTYLGLSNPWNHESLCCCCFLPGKPKFRGSCRGYCESNPNLFRQTQLAHLPILTAVWSCMGHLFVCLYSLFLIKWHPRHWVICTKLLSQGQTKSGITPEDDDLYYIYFFFIFTF